MNVLQSLNFKKIRNVQVMYVALVKYNQFSELQNTTIRFYIKMSIRCRCSGIIFHKTS